MVVRDIFLRMIEFRIQQFASTRKITTRRGERPIKTAYLFALATGINEETAKRLWDGATLRLDIEVLNAICEALDCQPGDLIVYTPKKTGDKKRTIARRKPPLQN